MKMQPTRTPRPPALRILFLAANPSAEQWLRLDHEAKAIERTLRESPHRDGIAVEACWAATADDLQRLLCERAPHVVHFSGHGSADGVLLESARRGHDTVSAEALAELLRLVNRDLPRVRAVILNACRSGAQLDALCDVVDCAIGMSVEVPDDAAIAFSSAFYRAIGLGRSLQDAFALAKNRLQIEHPAYVHAPQVRAREGARLGAQVLLPPIGSALDPPHGESSGRWLPGQGLKAGDVLAEGRFVLKEWLGQGTFATVWRAQDSAAGGDVALKVLHERYAADSVLHDRFFRGARLMTQLQQEAIVRVLDPCVSWHGYRFFVMEFVRGRTLMDHALAHRIGWREIVEHGLAVGRALAYAHERSCVHRDVKPANILIDERGQARLIDFDLVRDLFVEGGTRAGAMGTFAYAAPEVLDRPQEADGRCDQYSLAMTLACVMAGKEPSRQDKRDPARFVAALPCPPEVRRVIGRAVAWEAEERYGTMLGFCAALADAITTHLLRRQRMQLIRRSAAMSVGGLTLGLGVGSLVWLGVAGEVAEATRPSAAGVALLSSPTAPSGPTPPPVDPLEQALRVDHSRTAYAIRITADDTLAEAREHARAVLQTSAMQPWIVRVDQAGPLYCVYVGDYASRAQADADRLAARALRGEGALVRSMREECPKLRLSADGYHACSR